MALISIIFGLILDRSLRHFHHLRDLSWFENYSCTLASHVKIDNDWLKLIAVLALPVVTFALLQFALFGFLWNILYVMFGIVALFFCLGPACLNSDIDAYLDARSVGDDDEALHYAAVITERTASISPDQQTSDVTRAILSVANDRVFSVLFWFVLLGPLGAILFRLTSNICKRDESSRMNKVALGLHAGMAWAPARLLATGYALTGHFEGAFLGYQGRPDEEDIALANHDVLVNAGLGALRHQQASDEISCVRSARGLVIRSILLWVAMLALLTLGGWLG